MSRKRPKRLLSLHETNRERAAKLEEIRKRFKESRYDAVSSEFVNGALIATLLTQLLGGALGVGDTWDALKKQQRYKQLADPRFGSGKFPRGGNPWGGGGWGGGGDWGGGGWRQEGRRLWRRWVQDRRRFRPRRWFPYRRRVLAV